MLRFLSLAFLICASPVMGEEWMRALVARTEAAFPEIPRVDLTSDIGSACGGEYEGQGAYCPSERRIVLSDALLDDPTGPYVLAHLYGHALQVTYGVADVALAAIQADRSREAELRGMVTRQVECLAGVLLRRAGLPVPNLSELFTAEPMTGAHWGRNPVRLGPRVSIGMLPRQQWLSTGYDAAYPEACTVGEMDASLIVRNDEG